MEKFKVGIIILNFNSFNDSKRLISSIYRFEKKIDFRIFLIDNSLRADEQDRIRNLKSERVKTIILKENNGYANGNNIGIAAALKENCKYLLIANSDTEIVSDDTIYNLILTMKENNCLIIGPQILDFSEHKTGGACFLNCLGKVKVKFSRKPIWCHGLVGAFFLMSNDVVSNGRKINEDYFLYLEETDFFYLLYKDGYKILFYPYISVKHYGGKTTSEVYDYYIVRNRFLICKRCFRTPKFVLVIALFFELILVDVKQIVAVALRIKQYNYKYKRKLRWKGFFSGMKGEIGKKLITEG